MKAQVLDQPDAVENNPLHLREVERPTPGDREILVRVRACGVCHTDLHVVEGELPNPQAADHPRSRDRRRGRGARRGREPLPSRATASASPGCTRPTRPASTASTGRKTCATRRSSPATPSTAAMPSTSPRTKHTPSPSRSASATSKPRRCSAPGSSATARSACPT